MYCTLCLCFQICARLMIGFTILIPVDCVSQTEKKQPPLHKLTFHKLNYQTHILIRILECILL